MTDSRDTDAELARMLSELETTLSALRGTLTDAERSPMDRPDSERRRDAGRRERPPVPRPPRMRELLRFTEQQTIPTLIAILEANIRLLRFAGAALRAVDPNRSAVETGQDSAVSRALDAGGRLSTNRLSSGLDELQEALSGTEATNPEARQLLEEAERLSEEVRTRLRETEGSGQLVDRGGDLGATEPAPGEASGQVHIEVEDATAIDEEETPANADTDSGVDVDAELDSIRKEVRGEAEAKDAGAPPGSDDEDSTCDVADEEPDGEVADDLPLDDESEDDERNDDVPNGEPVAGEPPDDESPDSG
jgi:hypothetical protein